MNNEEIRQLIKDLENTEIPFLRKKLFNAETLIKDADNDGVVKQAEKDARIYREQIREYEGQVKKLKNLL